jgi:hypothetical protein
MYTATNSGTTWTPVSSSNIPATHYGAIRPAYLLCYISLCARRIGENLSESPHHFKILIQEAFSCKTGCLLLETNSDENRQL